MADHTTTHFEKMGESAIEGSLTNMSGKRSPYTIPKAKHAPSGDAMDGPTAKRGRGKDATGESNGPKFAPQTTICYPNDPVHNATGRGMRKVSPGSNFWSARASKYDDGETIVS